jgi:short-subunit dehydrogenase
MTATRRSMRGKHVVITGASSGIGRAVAIDMARRGLGSVSLLARSTSWKRLRRRFAEEAAARRRSGRMFLSRQSAAL